VHWDYSRKSLSQTIRSALMKLATYLRYVHEALKKCSTSHGRYRPEGGLCAQFKLCTPTIGNNIFLTVYMDPLFSK